MKLSKKITLLALVLGTLPVAALADDAGTLYLQGSTTGLGLGYAKSVSKDFALRGQYNSYKYGYTGKSSDLGSTATTTLDINMSSLQMLGDWYPGDGGFGLTGGLVLNDNKMTVTSTGATVGSATNQTVRGEIKMSDSPSPYLGLGYSTRPKAAKGFGFVFDLGVMFQDPKVSLTSTGTTNATNAEVENAKSDFQNAFKYWPVLGLGLSYSF